MERNTEEGTNEENYETIHAASVPVENGTDSPT
jgi:hypothetical protein